MNKISILVCVDINIYICIYANEHRCIYLYMRTNEGKRDHIHIYHFEWFLAHHRCYISINLAIAGHWQEDIVKYGGDCYCCCYWFLSNWSETLCAWWQISVTKTGGAKAVGWTCCGLQASPDAQNIFMSKGIWTWLCFLPDSYTAQLSMMTRCLH